MGSRPLLATRALSRSYVGRGGEPPALQGVHDQAASRAAFVQATRLAAAFNPPRELAGLTKQIANDAARLSALRGESARMTGQIANHAVRVTNFGAQKRPWFLIGSEAVAIGIDAVSDATEMIKAEPGPTARPSGTDRQGMSRREIAAYVAITVFFVAYFSCSVLLRYQPRARIVSEIDGPNPFEVAMFLAGLAYGITLTHGQD